MKIGVKTLRNNFRIKAMADEIDVATKPSFGESDSSQTECQIFTNRGKRKKITYDFLAQLLCEFLESWHGHTSAKQDDATQKGMTRTHQNQSLDILIDLIILSNIWRSAAFPYTQVARKAAKVLNRSLSFKSALLISQVLTNAFHSTKLNLFMFFSSLCFHRQRSSTFSI